MMLTSPSYSETRPWRTEQPLGARVGTSPLVKELAWLLFERRFKKRGRLLRSRGRPSSASVAVPWGFRPMRVADLVPGSRFR